MGEGERMPHKRGLHEGEMPPLVPLLPVASLAGGAAPHAAKSTFIRGRASRKGREAGVGKRSASAPNEHAVRHAAMRRSPSHVRQLGEARRMHEQREVHEGQLLESLRSVPASYYSMHRQLQGLRWDGASGSIGEALLHGVHASELPANMRSLCIQSRCWCRTKFGFTGECPKTAKRKGRAIARACSSVVLDLMFYQMVLV
mmetsp:Transcript_6128/g.15563  ORF Transcript_6128/g.15563 Transcript_6128/m.15563 type:complete len:201 (-) Transcript_6128:105-707(-)